MIVVPYKRGTTVTVVGVFPLAFSESYSVVARFKDPRSKVEFADWGMVCTIEHVGPTTNPVALENMREIPALDLHDYRIVGTAPVSATLMWPAPLDPQRNVDLIGSFYAKDAGDNVFSLPFDNIALRGLFS